MEVLYIGLLFIVIGLYSVFEDSYDLQASFKNKELIEAKSIEKDNFYRVKATLGLLSIVVGLFSIINYFYY